MKMHNYDVYMQPLIDKLQKCVKGWRPHAFYLTNNFDVDNPWISNIWACVWMCTSRLQSMCKLWSKCNLSPFLKIGKGCVWRISSLVADKPPILEELECNPL
jgi:hypothetical protein